MQQFTLGQNFMFRLICEWILQNIFNLLKIKTMAQFCLCDKIENLLALQQPNFPVFTTPSSDLLPE